MGLHKLMLINENSEKIAIACIRIIMCTLGFNIFIDIFRITLKIFELINSRLSSRDMQVKPTVAYTETINIRKMFD